MEIREESLSFLEEYARISIAFEVSRILDLSVRNSGVSGFELLERPVTPTVVKDYDAIPGNHPTDWARRFDLEPELLAPAEAVARGLKADGGPVLLVEASDCGGGGASGGVGPQASCSAPSLDESGLRHRGHCHVALVHGSPGRTPNTGPSWAASTAGWCMRCAGSGIEEPPP